MKNNHVGVPMTKVGTAWSFHGEFFQVTNSKLHEEVVIGLVLNGLHKGSEKGQVAFTNVLVEVTLGVRGASFRGRGW